MKNKIISLSLLSEYRTALMGLSILFIMLFHCHAFPLGYIGVEFFLILSAVGLTYSEHKQHRSYPDYLKRRMKRILPVYLLVSIPYFFFRKDGEVVDNVLFINLLKGVDKTYWYIFLLLFFYLLFPFLHKLLERKKLYWSLTAISVPLCLLLAMAFRHLDLMLCRLPIIMLSVWIGESAVRKGSVPSLLSFFLVIVGLALWLCFFAMVKNRVIFGYVTLYLITAVFCLPLLLCLTSIVRIPRLKPMFNALGKVTLELYMIHESIVRPLTRHFLLLFIDNPVILQAILIPLSIILAFLLSWCLNHFITWVSRSLKIKG